MKKESEMTENTNDKTLKLVNELTEVVRGVADSQGERDEKIAKISEDLQESMGVLQDSQSKMEATVASLVEIDEKKTKDIFDLVARDSAPAAHWGYSDPLTRALYAPHTKHEVGRGYVHDGKAYDVSDDVMDMNDSLYLMGMIKAIGHQMQNPGSRKGYEEHVKEFETYKFFQAELERDPVLAKALDTSTAGSGNEFVPQGFSARLIDDVRQALKVAALFMNVRIPARMDTMKSPVQGTLQLPYLIGEAASDSASKIGARTAPTADTTFSVINHGLRMLWSYNFEEDVALAIMPFIRSELVQALAAGEEKAIINGDTATTHQDTGDTVAASDILRSYEGLRKLCGGSSGNAAVDLSTVSLDNTRAIRKKMGRYGYNPAELAYITGFSGYIQLLTIDELITMDKIGSRANVLNGQMGMLDGSPVVVSEYVREDLNTSGIYDGTTETDTQLLVPNVRAFRRVDKPSGVRIEVGRDIETQQNVAVASRRLGFKETVTHGSGEETIGNGYSITS